GPADGGPEVEVACRLGLDTLEHARSYPRGGSDRRRREAEVPGHGAQRNLLRPAARALLQVSGDGARLLGIERAQRVERRQLAEALGPVGHSGSLVSAPSCLRSASMPRRMRVLTVPSGSSSTAAISAWVRPWKYASSIASRCSGPRRAMAPRTNRLRS